MTATLALNELVKKRSANFAEVYSEPCQTSKMELFAIIQVVHYYEQKMCQGCLIRHYKNFAN